MSAAADFLGVVGSKEIRAEDISFVAWSGNGKYEHRVPSEVGISASGHRWSWGFLDPSATGLTFKFLRRELEQPWSSETEFRSLVEEALAVSKYYGQTLGIVRKPDGSGPAFPAHVTKSGHDLVIYFLHGIAEAIKTDVKDRYGWDMITEMPVDLMVTYPPVGNLPHTLFRGFQATTVISQNCMQGRGADAPVYHCSFGRQGLSIASSKSWNTVSRDNCSQNCETSTSSRSLRRSQLGWS